MDWRCNRGGGRTLAAAREQYIYIMRKRYFINSAHAGTNKAGGPIMTYGVCIPIMKPNKSISLSLSA
jgi:hypothetical protein